MTGNETSLPTSVTPMMKPDEAGIIDPWDDTVADPVPETLKQTFPASDPPSWWAGRFPSDENTQRELRRR